MTHGCQHGSLSEFAELVSTGPFGSMLHKSDYVSSGVPLINPINIVGESIVPDPDKQVSADAVVRLSSYVLQSGDIVVGRRGEIGRCAVVGPEESGWICGTGCFFIRPKATVDSVFLAHMLRSPRYRELLESASTGATMKNMSNATLAGLPVSLPTLPDQRRIVAILDEVFKAITTAQANTEKNLRSASELFETHLGAIFVQRGEVTRLSECTTDISDGDHAPPPKSSTGVPFITISNVDKETRRIDFRETFMVPQAYFDALKPHRKPRPGDVLYTVTGSFGIPILVEDEREFCFQRHIGLIRPMPSVDSRWLTYALLSPQLRAQAEAGATGTAQRTVSLGVLRGMKIPKIEVGEQRRIADRLDRLSRSVEHLKTIARTKVAALEELKKSVLNQAFTGELTAKSIDQQVAEVA